MARHLGYEFLQNDLQIEYQDEIPGHLAEFQRQTSELLTHIWVKDSKEKSVDKK